MHFLEVSTLNCGHSCVANIPAFSNLHLYFKEAQSCISCFYILLFLSYCNNHGYQPPSGLQWSGVLRISFFFLIIVLSQLYGLVFLWIPGLLSGDIEFNPGRNIPIFFYFTF